ncbi:hypothetical protein HDV00_007014 [Rhizophlyctis rosea]|nr:hypothetical protein HDV00_007014 [Rhizophlyctis rosea]
MNREPILLSDSLLDQFSLSAIPREQRKPGITEYLFRTPELLDEAIQAALHSHDIRADDCEFFSATRGWVECIELGSMDAYEKRFCETNTFFGDRLADGSKVSAKMIESIAEKTHQSDDAGYEFDSIEDAVEEMKRGNFVVVVDNEDRENEGDLIIAAEDFSPEKAAFLIRHSSGIICVPMLGERLDELELPLMVTNKENTESLRTAYTITVDYKHGTTTGISAADRSATVRALSSPSSQPGDFNRPGHVFPLRYAPGGVLTRIGHTEASVDLCVLAGKQPVAAICEVALDDGTMARRGDLRAFAKRWGLKMITISDLVKFRSRKEGR